MRAVSIRSLMGIVVVSAMGSRAQECRRPLGGDDARGRSWHGGRRRDGGDHSARQGTLLVDGIRALQRRIFALAFGPGFAENLRPFLGTTHLIANLQKKNASEE